MTQLLEMFYWGLLKEASPFEVSGPPPPTPTEGQIGAGNYKKDHIRFAGLELTVENRAGSVRSGTDASGKKWSIKMPWHYGYIRKTEAPDGDHIDVFLKPDSGSPFMCYIIRQVKPGTDVFDEYKCMVGWRTRDEAVKAYLAAYERGWTGYGGCAALPLPAFKRWVVAPFPISFKKDE